MIGCIFTIDYEVYGNGEGSLKDLVWEPARKLKAMFEAAGAKLVVFVEAAEFERIKHFKADVSIERVEQQILDFHKGGHEIALHLHPQWSNAEHRNGKWTLDYQEYNLCSLPTKRISEIVDGAINYLRGAVRDQDFAPFSFRAGNWLFQPTRRVGEVLARRGIKVDSSVFKGGLQHQHGLDYRRALTNGPYWTFQEDAARSDPAGELLEIPIYTRMVPFWKMATSKRFGLHQKSAPARRTFGQKLARLRDFARLRQPLKFDFCRMNLSELIGITQTALQEDQENPAGFKPMVAIGHTKDLLDFTTVEAYLIYLRKIGIGIYTLEDCYPLCRPGVGDDDPACLSGPTQKAL